MCGIVGYVGENNSVDILMNGLYSLEYRGYDSAGISIVENDNIITFKSEGKIENLQNIIDKNKKNRIKYWNRTYKMGDTWSAFRY